MPLIVSYAVSGAVTSMRLGNGRWKTTKFNSRLQPIELGLGSPAADTGLWKVGYDYGELQTNGTVDVLKNNGNIAKQTLTIPGTNFVQAYKYDPLNRLTEAKETTGTTQNWIQNFGYDIYGNRTSFNQTIGSITANTTPSIDANTNRFNGSQGFSYDQNGNVTQDVDSANNHIRQFVFNSDNKQTQVKDVTNNNHIVGTYFYDGEGKRVKKVTDTETTIFVYSLGRIVAEYSTQLSSAPSVNYTTTDHLGSPRIITDQLGQVKSRRDFMPFGEEIFVNVGARTTTLKYGSSADEIRQKFTGYQKDTETSLDFAEARMYENRFGRFTAIDPYNIVMEVQSQQDRQKALKDLENYLSTPAKWNRYVYVLNLPTRHTDPTGRDIVIIENKATDGNPAGHTAIAITGRGVFSMGNAEKEPQRDGKNNIVGGSLKAYIKRESGRRDTQLIVIKTTKEQDAAIARKLTEDAANKPQLTSSGGVTEMGVLNDNCSTRVNVAMDAGKIGSSEGGYTNIPGIAGNRAISYALEKNQSYEIINVQQNSALNQAQVTKLRQFEPSEIKEAVGKPR